MINAPNGVPDGRAPVLPDRVGLCSVSYVTLSLSLSDKKGEKSTDDVG